MIEMQNIELPKFKVLKGKEAIKVLHEYIDELQQGKENILTEEQTSFMIKIAQGLISSIENETKSEELTKEQSLLAQVKNVFNSLLRESPKGSIKELSDENENFNFASNLLRPIQHLWKKSVFMFYVQDSLTKKTLT